MGSECANPRTRPRTPSPAGSARHQRLGVRDELFALAAVTAVLRSAIACAGRMNASEEGRESKLLDHVAELTTIAAIRSVAFSPRRGEAVMAVAEVHRRRSKPSDASGIS